MLKPRRILPFRATLGSPEPHGRRPCISVARNTAQSHGSQLCMVCSTANQLVPGQRDTPKSRRHRMSGMVTTASMMTKCTVCRPAQNPRSAAGSPYQSSELQVPARIHGLGHSGARTCCSTRPTRSCICGTCPMGGCRELNCTLCRPARCGI